MQKKHTNPHKSPQVAGSFSQVASQSHLAKGYALHQQGHLEQAKLAYQEALRLYPRNFEALQLMGTLFAQTKQILEALNYFDKAIAVNDKNAGIFNNRGMVLMELNNPALAVQSYDKAIALRKDYPEAYSNRGNALQAINQLHPANASYDLAIALRPDFADTYNNKGVVLHRMGEFRLAITSFNCAAQIHPAYAQAYYNCARAYAELGDLTTALDYYKQAIHLYPSYLDAFNNMGNILLELKDFNGALESFDKGLTLNGNVAQLHNNKGNVYRELKRFDEAINSYTRAIQIYPQYIDAHNNLGNVFQELKRFSDALICYNLALHHNPVFVDALSNKGVVLRELKQNQEAVACYIQALALNPQFAQGYFNLGNAFKELDQPEWAQKSYKRALAVDSKYHGAKWGIALLNIPTFVQSVEHLESSRLALSLALDELDSQCSDPGFLNATSSVGLHQPFYLAYQERNNKALMQQYSAVCHKVMTHWQRTFYNTQVTPLTPELESVNTSHSKKIRLGIVSDQIRYHSVWNAITKGLVEHLNPEQFEIHIYYLGTISDEQTAFAKSRAVSFTQNLPSLKDWANAIGGARLDAVLYPEIGMHALTLQLAHLRLAPIQMVSWGHPETTGIPTMDYFISSELFEGEDSQNAYSEKLFTLPSLGCTYEELQIKPERVDLSAYGVREDSIKLLCPGMLFKYSPEYDWTFVAIAKQLNQLSSSLEEKPTYQFLFLYRDEASSALLQARLQQVFASEGLDMSEWVVFLPWMSPQAFYGLMHVADLFLDTLGFSGFNTAMQAIECGLPIVTKRGRFLRGRFASAILSKLGLGECIASTDQEYVNHATLVASDPLLREKISSKILTERRILFNDLNPVRAFEALLSQRLQS